MEAIHIPVQHVPNGRKRLKRTDIRRLSTARTIWVRNRRRRDQITGVETGLATSLRMIPHCYNHSLRILISAGEASGELYGAQLIEALRRAYAHVGTAAIGCPAEQSSASL